MSNTCQVYLVPGFFGFTALGAYNYFYRVGDVLQEHLLKKHGIDATIVQCATQPTSSIRRRAESLLEDVENNGGRTAQSIHFVGHSAGGLDVRLLLSPGVDLRDDKAEHEIARNTRSVTTISTPHYGTPLASFFTTMQGRRMLQLLTALANNKAGRKSLFWMSKVLSLAARMDDWTGRRNTFLDTIVDRLFKHISADPDDPFWKFMEQVKLDQGAIIQLTPESMHIFNAAVSDRKGVDYRCVMTAAGAPTAASLARSFPSPASAGSFLLFSFLYNIAAREHKHYPYPRPGDEVYSRFMEVLGDPLTPASNDGIAPSISQVHGELLDIQMSDHLDVVGQFEGAGDERFTDWLVSDSGFNKDNFNSVWSRVGDAIAASHLK
jgi:hypothetical protein